MSDRRSVGNRRNVGDPVLSVMPNDVVCVHPRVGVVTHLTSTPMGSNSRPGMVMLQS